MHIFRGAVVSVDGQEEIVRDYAWKDRYETPTTIVLKGDLVIEFKSGRKEIYDARRIEEIPGVPPEFIYEGAMIFIKDPPSLNPDENRFREAGNGAWEITHWHFEKEDGEENIRLLLKRPWQEGKGFLSRHFNSRTMTELKDHPDIPKARKTPVYELADDLQVKKPLVLKRPQ
jgi:hypothetical protein